RVAGAGAADVERGGEIRRVAAARRPGASGLLRERVGRRDGDDETGAEQADEIAALQLEDVAARLGELVAFDVERRIRRRRRIRRIPHFPPPIIALFARMRSAARRTALTIRGYVPQRQTLR